MLPSLEDPFVYQGGTVVICILFFQSLYNVNYMYFQPIVVTSILFGIWGMLMTLKMLGEILKDYHIQVLKE